MPDQVAKLLLAFTDDTAVVLERQLVVEVAPALLGCFL